MRFIREVPAWTQGLLRSPQDTLRPKLPRLLPRPFRRGEGWGEGLLGVVYPAVLAVSSLGESKFAPATARARVPAPGLAAMRDFHAWPGITGSAFFILHSTFCLRPPGGALQQARRYGGGMGAVWGRCGVGLGAPPCGSRNYQIMRNLLGRLSLLPHSQLSSLSPCSDFPGRPFPGGNITFSRPLSESAHGVVNEA